jgi:hypothetical protein
MQVQVLPMQIFKREAKMKKVKHNVILGLALEYATQKEKKVFTLTRKQVKHIIEEAIKIYQRKGD